MLDVRPVILERSTSANTVKLGILKGTVLFSGD